MTVSTSGFYDVEDSSPLPLGELFPFLIELDDRLQVVQTGPLMPKACPGLQPGDSLAEAFRHIGRHPAFVDFEQLAGEHRRPVCLQQIQPPKLVFRGEWFVSKATRRLFFLGWPWVTDPDELTALGISLQAIPAHNPLGDLLLLLRTNRNTLSDTQDLSDILRQRTQALEASNRRLQDEAVLIRARDEAERASRAKSTFLANMSHELRTPLSGIIGMTSLLLKRSDDPKSRDQLGKILGASNHLLAVINDILDISKIEADRMALEAVPFTLSGVIENVRNALHLRANNKRGLEIRLAIPPALLTRVLTGDPLRLGQVLINLLGNSIKFTTQGHIAVHADIVHEAGGSLTVRFEIEDTGIGVPLADQERLFLAFEQADSSTTRRHGGTGLGLAICKRLVELMGGAIGVRSTPGQGSTFWFTAQLAAEHCSLSPQTSKTCEPAAEEAIRTGYAGTRVLIAEDEPVNQEILRELLEHTGLAVDVANDGRQALEMSRQNHYALILMDMQMPQMSGIEATKSIRHQSLNTATPILATTANAFDEDRNACLEAGMDSHLPKPISPTRLYEAVLHWLRRGVGSRT